MKLIKFPNDILKATMPDFDFENPVMDPMQIEKEMVELMVRENGIGLSANQVGLETRVITIFPKDLSLEMGPFAMFNPVIRETSQEEIESFEGCLSFPRMIIPVKRKKIVIVEYLDSEANTCIMQLSDTDAKCVQHEIDHLNGICFIDRVSRLKMQMAQKKIDKIRKRYGRTQRQS